MWKLFSAQNSVHNRKNFAIERGLSCFLAIERSRLRRFATERSWLRYSVIERGRLRRLATKRGWLCCVGGM